MPIVLLILIGFLSVIIFDATGSLGDVFANIIEWGAEAFSAAFLTLLPDLEPVLGVDPFATVGQYFSTVDCFVPILTFFYLVWGGLTIKFAIWAVRWLFRLTPWVN